MTIGKQTSAETETTTGARPSRRRKRRPAVLSHELSPEKLGEAALELVRLAVEYETPHALVDPALTASDRMIRRVVGELSGRDAVLKKLVNAVFDYRDRRQALVDQIRWAQALRDIADEVQERRQKWNAEQGQRQKKREPRHAWGSSESTKRELAEYMRATLGWWQVPRPQDVLPRLVDVAVSRSSDAADERKGVFKRLADAAVDATDVSSDKLEKIAAALGGSPQRAGRIKTPEDARHVLDDDPVGGSEILRYVVRLLVARGYPEHVEDAVMNVWGDQVSAILHATHGTSPAASDDPAPSQGPPPQDRGVRLR